MPGHTVTDLYALRHLTRGSGGFPESQGGSDWLRPVAWKVLLGLVPVEKKEWASTLAKRREEYYVSMEYERRVRRGGEGEIEILGLAMLIKGLTL